MRLVRSLDFRGWALLGAAALCIALPGVVATPGGSAHAGVTLEERKLPMKFNWVACQPNCRGWVSAVGIVTADSPREFDEFARGRQLGGVTIVLDSSGGSVNDSIALGRRWRNLGALTTVGSSIQTRTAQGERAAVAPEAYLRSRCACSCCCPARRATCRRRRISGCTRSGWATAPTTPGPRAYSAQDLMIVERDIGRLAKYTFDMGGTGDLLSLALSVPPWEDLHELSRAELRLTNLVTTDAVADVLPHLDSASVPVAEVPGKADAGSLRRATRSEAKPIRNLRSRPRLPKPRCRPAVSCRLSRPSSRPHLHSCRRAPPGRRSVPPGRGASGGFRRPAARTRGERVVNGTTSGGSRRRGLLPENTVKLQTVGPSA